MSYMDISSFFGTASTSNSTSNMNMGLDLSDYAAIRNGSYSKLMKAHYKKQEEEKAASINTDSDKQLTSIKSNADALKKAADALEDSSLWEKKTITRKNEETGEEETVQDYDRDAIYKAVKSFADAYNSTISAAGDSDTKDVLRYASWMTTMTAKHVNLLSNIGIEVGSDNKLSVDEEDFKKADIGSIKLMFNDTNSFAAQAASKASGISNAAARQSSTTYTKNGTYAASSFSTSKSSQSTSSVDDEVKSLRSQRDALKEKIDKEYSAENKAKLEKELKAVEKELAAKDNDFYRQQNSKTTIF
ncbi:MAG: hypothetical protein J6P05_07380 [Lachnospiraceae bacterium]|nr:hypothetical protein [Lachnospiraceae bacterium]